MARPAVVTAQGAGRRMRQASVVAALVLGGLVLVLAVAAVPLARLAHQSLNASTGSTPVWITAPAGVVGFVVAWRKPGNPLGWIILVAAVFSILTKDASYYAVADYRLHHGGLPLGWVALLAQPGWTPAIVLLGLTVLLFPNGRPPSPRWRWVLWVYAGIGLVWIAGTVVITVGAIIGHHTQVDSRGNLLLLSGNDPATGWWNAGRPGQFGAAGAGARPYLGVAERPLVRHVPSTTRARSRLSGPIYGQLISARTAPKAAAAVWRSSRLWAAESCVLIRALPTGTTG